MKTTLTVQSIHTGETKKITFDSREAKETWVQNNAQFYVLKGVEISKR